ncbi:MAG: hypothetical protein MJZ52_07205 [Bacteroidales bacterium]|nr:hypothetical protein [Bacteroidales bacterium]
MRIRYEMFENGHGTGDCVECDLSDKQAKRKFKDLSKNARCGWAELVGEDDDNYMEIIDEFDHIDIAQTITSFDVLFK